MNDWPIVGTARFRAESHGSNQVWVLDCGSSDPRDCGSVYTPVCIGSNFYGYRVVCSQEWRRTLEAARAPALATVQNNILSFTINVTLCGEISLSKNTSD